MTLGGCTDFRISDRHACARFGRSDQPAPAVFRRMAAPSQGAMVAGEIDPQFWHEGPQSCNEIHRIQAHPGRPVPVRCLQGIENLAGGTVCLLDAE